MKKLLLLFVISGILACTSDESGQGLVGNIEKTTIQIAMQYKESSRFDSLVLHGEGADTIHLRIDEPESVLELELFPALWKFYAHLYAKGTLMQKGESEIEVQNGKTNYLQIPMKALFGFVDITLPLGLDNSSHITSGTLELKTKDTSYIYEMEIEEPFGKFATDALPINETYNVLLQLFDKNGDCIFKAEDTLKLNEENAVQEWNLESLKGSLSITFLTDLLQTHSIQANLPKGSPRLVKAKDVLISEFLPIPEQTGTDYEFVELYNGTNDSLLLTNCELHGGSPKTATLPDSILLLPGSYTAIGADSAIDASIHTVTKWPSLTNTKQSILLQCEGSTIDSVFYGQIDSLQTDFIQIKSGESTQLILTKWNKKNSGNSWCLSSPTPGKAANCGSN